MKSTMFLTRYLKDRRGGSTVEFAVIVPILAGVLTWGLDSWLETSRKQDMHAAVQAGVHYYMGGGSDDTAAQTVVQNAWPNMPSGGTVTISRACTCAGASTSCSTLCAATALAPEIQITVAAQSQWTGLRPATLNESETARVR